MEKALFKKLVISYLRFLSRRKLNRSFNGSIIALGGCYGKSSAVSLLEQVLKHEHKVYTSNRDGKGLNSESGIPFTILGIKPDKYRTIDWFKYCIKGLAGLYKPFDHDMLIFELGVDKPDDLKFLTSFIRPNVGILINSNNTHAANFEDLQKTTGKSFEELIAYENGYIFEASKDAIVYNNDDPEVVKQISRFSGDKRIPFSEVSGNKISTYSHSLKGTHIEFEYQGKMYQVDLTLVLLDEYRSTIEMMLAVAEYFNVKAENVINGLHAYTLPPSRCSLFEGIKHTHLIDSSYNSSYLPAASALKLLRSIAPKRAIAVLGDMRELGILSEKEHRKLALIASSNADIVITVGPLMRKFFNDEFKSLAPDKEIYSFDTTKEALEFIADSQYSFLNEEDTILIKGSQNTLMLEAVVESLLADKAQANELCRRGNQWDEVRAKLLA